MCAEGFGGARSREEGTSQTDCSHVSSGGISVLLIWGDTACCCACTHSASEKMEGASPPLLLDPVPKGYSRRTVSSLSCQKSFLLATPSTVQTQIGRACEM